MRIIYRDSADFDLEGIERFYAERSAQGLKSVMQDMVGAINNLKQHPESGRLLNNDSVRRVISPKYRYCITYIHKTDIVEIIGIFRYQNRNV